MKKSDITVGKTYRNKGAGKTKRKVLAIGDEYRPTHYWSPNPPPNEPGVLYEQNGLKNMLYLSSFAQWCGGVIE